MATVLCSAQLGRKHCGTKMVERVDGLGRVTFHCPACARKAQGLCRCCPKPTRSKGSWYCVACAARIKKARHARITASEDYKAGRKVYGQRYHRQQRKDPVKWADRLAKLNAARRHHKEQRYGKAYIEAHPRGHAGRTLPRQNGRWVSQTTTRTSTLDTT